MGASLQDITIYYWGTKQKDASDKWLFGRMSNFVCDFYHRMLSGYKPPKTSRICIHLNDTKNFEEPIYSGSICAIAQEFDEEAFIGLSESHKCKFILDLVHGCCLELAERFGWEKQPFEKAYTEVTRREFSFVIDYPVKRSRDNKTAAHVQITKTKDATALYLIFTEEDTQKEVKLFEKKNRFWYDSAYEMAKHSKWLNASTFGVYSKRSNKFGYYSLTDDVVIGNLNFRETDV